MDRKTPVHIEEITPNDLKQIVELHMTTMPSLLTDLGRQFVYRFYHLALSDPNTIALGARDDSGLLIGWAFGHTSPQLLNSRLSTPWTWFLPQISKVAVFRPWVFFQLIRSVLHSQNAPDLPRGGVELVYIGVASAARGSGVGSSLLNAFTDTTRRRGLSEIFLSVEVQNNAAITAYSANGFTIVSTYHEGSYQRHRMLKQIPTSPNS